MQDSDTSAASTPENESHTLQVLFLNMESDIGAAAAFVFAHNEAIKGMRQMLQQIEAAYDCNDAAEAEKQLVSQVRQCMRDVCAWAFGKGCLKFSSAQFSRFELLPSGQPLYIYSVPLSAPLATLINIEVSGDLKV
jgi:hypothetical protein